MDGKEELERKKRPAALLTAVVFDVISGRNESR